MYRQRNEHTIAQSCQMTGRGYWTGREVTVTFHPAGPRHGIEFVRTDLTGCPSVKAVVQNRCDIDYRTVLRDGRAEVAMVEHLLAALYALEIDNCVIEIDGSEVPGWDGSALAVVEHLRAAGLVMQVAKRESMIVDRRMRVGSPGCWIEAVPQTGSRLTVEYRLDYGPDSPIAEQSFAVAVTPESFCRELAAARTFVTSEQVAELKAKGIAKHVQPDELLVFGEQGLVSGQMRWPDECARHKALDLIGDLALAGVEIVGRVISYRGGHRLNASMAQNLGKQLRANIAIRRAA